MTRQLSTAAVLIGALVCAVAAPAGAEGMTKTQERDLKKALRKLDQIERAVEGLETSRSRGTPAFPAAAERKASAQERRFSDVEEALGELPGDQTKEAKEKLAQLRQRLQVVVDEARQQTAGAAEDAKAWEAHRGSDAYRAETAEIEGFAVYEAFLFTLDHRGLKIPWEEEFRALNELLDALPQVKARHAELVKRYEAFGQEGRHTVDKLRWAAERFAECEAAMQKAGSGALVRLVELGKTLDEETAKVFKLRDQARAQKRPFPLGYSLMDDGCVCKALERQIERTRDYAKRLVPGQAAALDATATQSLTGYRDAVTQATDEILEGQESPADDYAGADRDEVVAFVTQAVGGRLHGKSLRSVHLSGRWEQTEGWRWDRTAKVMVKIKKSSLAGSVLVEHDGTYALKRRIEVERDHLRGDALQLFGDFVDYPKPLPDKLIPLSKLK